MSFAVVFSGQGLQHARMLPWLNDDPIVRAACTMLGSPDWRSSMGEEAWDTNNANAQILLTGLALAAWSQLKIDLPNPAAFAGYSVGALPAFSASGIFCAQAALNLALKRAQAMDRCAARMAGGLLAIGGIAPCSLQHLLQHGDLYLAIRNGFDSVIVGGPLASLDRACRECAGHAASCTRLRVSVASHTPLMQEASAWFLETLQATALCSPRYLLFGGRAHQIANVQDARRELALELSHTVQWDECMENIHARGVRCVLEVGAGNGLAKMWNKKYPDIPARACDDFRSRNAVVEWVLDKKIA
ncbi:MAG: acyltransferase domain-containing protein [Pseudomonadota bacterium]